MKLKFLFFFLALLLTAVWTILIVLTLKERGALFYIGEGVITFSLVFLVYFYRKVVKPLDIIGNGMELLREQDFSSRLTPVGQKEADRIVLVFNRMMEQLKDERLRLREQNHFLDLLVSASPMGVVILTLDGHISMLNAAALRFLDYSSAEEVRGRLLCELASPLAEEIERIPKDTTETIRLSDSMIYRCSRLSFVDRGFSHPFILVESLTSEVVKAEKKAYEKVIRMIAHEVNNTTAGITSTLDTVDGALECMKIMSVMDAFAVEVPLPGHKLDAAFGGVARQHRVTKVSKDAVVTSEIGRLELWRGFQNRHVLRSHFGGVDDALQRILRPDAVHTLLPVQHAALAGDAAETPFFPADG